MNKEYLKGVLDARISALLSESDFSTFASLSAGEKLSFFINNGLVSTNIVTNFEALSKHFLDDLKREIQSYLEKDTLYVDYFFAKEMVSRNVGALYTHYEEVYARVIARNDKYLRYYLDYKFSLLNIINILRAKKRGDDQAKIYELYLTNSLMNKEAYISLVNSDFSTLITYVKNTFNIDLYERLSNAEIEAKFDDYLYLKVKDLAVETDVYATLVYYIKMKKYELTRLRNINYTGRNNIHG